MTEQNKKIIKKHYLKGSLTINGLLAMGFEVRNVLDGSTPVKHYDYSDSCLNLSI